MLLTYYYFITKIDVPGIEEKISKQNAQIDVKLVSALNDGLK